MLIPVLKMITAEYPAQWENLCVNAFAYKGNDWLRFFVTIEGNSDSG
jgi:hypothetical protein